MKIKDRKKFIARVLEAVTILVSFIITPFAINYASMTRGNEAIGSECLLPLLGLIIAMIIETIYKESNRR